MLGAIALILLAAYTSLIAAALFGWLGLRFEGEIKPIETATFFLNLGIAVYLQFFFVRKLANNRVEKDLLLEMLKNSLSRAQRIQEQFEAIQGPLSEELLKQLIVNESVLARRLSDFETALPQTHAKSLSQKLPTLKDARYLFKRATTNYVPGSQPTRPQVIEQDYAFRNLRELITALIFGINRHAG